MNIMQSDKRFLQGGENNFKIRKHIPFVEM